ncbi:MAG: flagellar biosynthesis regulator FlaF [Rhodospirillales bacterium]
MQSYEQKLKRYQRIQAPEAGNPRRTEAWALLEAAKRMAVAVSGQDMDAKKQEQEMKSAIRLNWRLWTIFQAELTSAHSQAPEDIRDNMLTLCQFVDKHTVGCLAEATPEKLRHLIDLNRNIAAGLMGSASDDAEEDRRIKEAAGVKVEDKTPPPPPSGPSEAVKVEMDV